MKRLDLERNCKEYAEAHFTVVIKILFLVLNLDLDLGNCLNINKINKHMNDHQSSLMVSNF